MKKKLKILMAFTSVCLIAFLIVMVMMIKENGECVDNPFGYSAMRLKESGGNYYCSCSSLDTNLLDFTFNEEGIKIIQEENNLNLNFSNIKFSN